MKKVGAISLALLLLLALGIEGMVTDRKNNCKCKRMSARSIPVRFMTNFEVFTVSSSCDKLEYVVTLKKPLGMQLCLDPTSQKVQTTYKNYLALKNQKAEDRSRRQIRHQ
ncbi:C-X-C motif chemokine 9 [Ahaetulla prasina]|uniref:C-X-C motif chemokine 9 n=1 Tax=Ahaetulla prasina TaxID=499056 RepID=UPI00264A4524|nr:C-X-C motif chemokine 9 [Ahaetulla prasina]